MSTYLEEGVYAHEFSTWKVQRGHQIPPGYEVIGLGEPPDMSAEFRSSAGAARTLSG